MKAGDQVTKVKGYEFPGTVVSVFQTTRGETRLVVEMHRYGLLHIFNEKQLKLATPYIPPEDLRLDEMTLEPFDYGIKEVIEY